MKKRGEGFTRVSGGGGLAAGLLVLLFIVSCRCSLPFGGTVDALSLLTYNVQNLCDDVDHGIEYREYDPEGGEWDTRLYHQRLLSLAGTLRNHPAGGADIILLQEVENRNVLEELTGHYLRGGGYHFLAITEIPDSPINLACLSRFPLSDLRLHAVTIEGEPAGRPLMELEVECGGSRLRILHCHWKSKRGGARETERLRRAAAAVAAARIARLERRHPGLPILLAGDLNENADEWGRVGAAYPTALMPLTAVGAVEEAPGGQLWLTGERSVWAAVAEDGAGASPVPLFSPWLAGETGAAGSYYYDGRWETIDHVLLNRAFCDGEGLEYRSCSLIDAEHLLTEGGTPLRWISRTGAGYSDHLPLLVRFELLK